MPDSKKLLVAYATWAGSTRGIAEIIADEVRRNGLDADVAAARTVISLDDYAAVILGAPMHAGFPHRDARGFVQRFRRRLSALPAAFFLVGISIESNPIEKARNYNERCLDRVIAAAPELKPVERGYFPGAILTDTKEFKHMGFLLQAVHKRMRSMGDKRDPQAVRAWARLVLEKIGPAKN
jgi:menaquinone-dependent protoporphyrinogen oxidase